MLIGSQAGGGVVLAGNTIPVAVGYYALFSALGMGQVSILDEKATWLTLIHNS